MARSRCRAPRRLKPRHRSIGSQSHVARFLEVARAVVCTSAHRAGTLQNSAFRERTSVAFVTPAVSSGSLWPGLGPLALECSLCAFCQGRAADAACSTALLQSGNLRLGRSRGKSPATRSIKDRPTPPEMSPSLATFCEQDRTFGEPCTARRPRRAGVCEASRWHRAAAARRGDSSRDVALLEAKVMSPASSKPQGLRSAPQCIEPEHSQTQHSVKERR